MDSLTAELSVVTTERDKARADLGAIVQSLQNDRIGFSERFPSQQVAYHFSQRPRHLAFFAKHGHNWAVALWPKGKWSPGKDWVNDPNVRYVVGKTEGTSNPYCPTIQIGGWPQYHEVPASMLDWFFRPDGPGGFSITVHGAEAWIATVADPAAVPFGN